MCLTQHDCVTSLYPDAYNYHLLILHVQVVESTISTGTVEETPLARACGKGNMRMAEILVKYGAKVNRLCSVSE